MGVPDARVPPLTRRGPGRRTSAIERSGDQKSRGREEDAIRRRARLVLAGRKKGRRSRFTLSPSIVAGAGRRWMSVGPSVRRTWFRGQWSSSSPAGRKETGSGSNTRCAPSRSPGGSPLKVGTRGLVWGDASTVAGGTGSEGRRLSIESGGAGALLVGTTVFQHYPRFLTLCNI